MNRQWQSDISQTKDRNHCSSLGNFLFQYRKYDVPLILMIYVLNIDRISPLLVLLIISKCNINSSFRGIDRTLESPINKKSIKNDIIVRKSQMGYFFSFLVGSLIK